MTTLARTRELATPTAVRDEPSLPSFADLGVSEDLVATLAARGITEPFPVQVLTIPDALAGRDVCGKAKTGSGKTLAFGLALVERTQPSPPRRPYSLVLVPTRELANQVAEELTPLAAARGLWITAIYGGISMDRQLRALRAGVDIVIATPGRLNDLIERREMSVADVRMVVIDEADQMADMGFLPQVERILRRIDGPQQTLLFSATLDGAVDSLVRRYQHDPVSHSVAAESDTIETMEHRFIEVGRNDRVDVLAAICAAYRRTLVFVRTKHGADRLAKQLERAGVNAGAIHGDRGQGNRERTLATFVSGNVPVLVATNIAARGIHVDGIDVVVHFDPPEDPKTYLHRSGRTARAGESGLVVTLVLREQLIDVDRLQRDAGVSQPIVEMRSDDPRLADLGAWQPDQRARAPQLAMRQASEPEPAAPRAVRRRPLSAGRRRW